MVRSNTTISPHSTSASGVARGPLRIHHGARLLALGAILIAGALWLRSSIWLRDYILKAKDIGELESLVSTSPGDSVARYYLAKSYYLARRYSEAAEEYREAVALDPKSARAEIGLGLSLYELGDARGSRLAFERALTLDSKSAWAEYMLAKLAWSAGDVELALDHTRRATELDPRSDQAWYGLASCYVSKRQYPQAIAALKNVVARNPQSVAGHTGLGEFLIFRGEIEQGIRHLERALVMDPRNATACVLLGRHLAKHAATAAELERAEVLLLRAIELRGPRLFDVHLEIGRLLLRRKRPDAAMRHLKAAARLASDDERTHYALADIYRRMGKLKEAAACEARFKELSARHIRMQQLETMVYTQPHDARARLELARLYVRAGMFSQAGDQYSRYLAQNPNDSMVAAEFAGLAELPRHPAAHSGEFTLSPPSQ